MSLFVIGDTHLSLSVDKPMDVFRGWTDYVDRLCDNWNAVVGENVAVTALPAPQEWTTERGLEVFGPRSFGHDVDYTPYC